MSDVQNWDSLEYRLPTDSLDVLVDIATTVGGFVEECGGPTAQ